MSEREGKLIDGKWVPPKPLPKGFGHCPRCCRSGTFQEVETLVIECMACGYLRRDK